MVQYGTRDKAMPGAFCIEDWGGEGQWPAYKDRTISPSGTVHKLFLARSDSANSAFERHASVTRIIDEAAPHCLSVPELLGYIFGGLPPCFWWYC